MTCTSESGTCPRCVGLCRKKPGWFMPGEAERVAGHLGVTLPDLFASYLGVDWHEGSDAPTFVLAPAVTTMDPGGEYPGDPAGTCVFLTGDGRCGIHPVKPYECRRAWCGEDVDTPEARGRHAAVAAAWEPHHQQIVDLLGAEPLAEPYASPWLM